jgi:hypothetical protein
VDSHGAVERDLARKRASGDEAALRRVPSLTAMRPTAAASTGTRAMSAWDGSLSSLAAAKASRASLPRVVTQNVRPSADVKTRSGLPSCSASCENALNLLE